jgi:hypothetical protein
MFGRWSMPFYATSVVAALILLTVVVLYFLRASGYIEKGSSSAKQKGIVVGLCLGLMFNTTFGPAAGMAFGFIVGSLIDDARSSIQIAD